MENKAIDEIGKALVKANALSSLDIDRIVANQALFDAVRARVKLESREPVAGLSFLRPSVGAFASIALVAAAALAFVVFKSGSGEVAVNPTREVPTSGDTKRFSEPDNVVDAGFSRTASPPKVERISTKPEIKINRPRQSAAQQIRYEGDFYALSYAGDPNETERGGRIVRVDIPRSTLFAMGIDIPLENEAETVKADLLVGNDGVTRAIRVVK